MPAEFYSPIPPLAYPVCRAIDALLKPVGLRVLIVQHGPSSVWDCGLGKSYSVPPQRTTYSLARIGHEFDL
jgi:hypothetical protein